MRPYWPRTIIALVVFGFLAVGAYISVRSGLLWLFGGRDYRFQTTAVYDAPATGFRLEVDAAGVVEAGHDLSERSRGTASVSPLGEPDRIFFQMTFAQESAVAVRFGDLSPEPVAWSWRDREATFRSLLERAGCDPVDSIEVSEAARAIEGALAGPKGTISEGQSDALRVVRVSLRYPLSD